MVAAVLRDPRKHAPCMSLGEACGGHRGIGFRGDPGSSPIPRRPPRRRPRTTQALRLPAIRLPMGCPGLRGVPANRRGWSRSWHRRTAHGTHRSPFASKTRGGVGGSRNRGGPSASARRTSGERLRAGCIARTAPPRAIAACRCATGCCDCAGGGRPRAQGWVPAFAGMTARGDDYGSASSASTSAAVSRASSPRPRSRRGRLRAPPARTTRCRGATSPSTAYSSGPSALSDTAR